MALIGEMQYLTIGGNTYSLPVGGGGTVTSVAVSNATNGGLSISGSPISSNGTITIGHSNVLTAAQTTQAVYPIKIDKNGHISEYGSAVTIPTKVSDLTNDSGFITSYTDENMKWTASTSSNTYYPLQSTSTATTSTANTLNGINFYQYYNTAGGYRRLNLGNTTAYKSTGGAYGTIRLYGAAATYYGDLVPGVLGTTSGDGHISANRTWTLPDATGTIALTSDIPDVSGKIDTAGTGLSKSGTTLNHSNSVTAQTTLAVYPIKIDAQGHISEYGSAVTIPSITLNGSSTTSPSFYAPTSVGTSGYVLTSSGSGAPSWTSAVLTDEKVKTSTTVVANHDYGVVFGDCSNTTETKVVSSAFQYLENGTNESYLRIGSTSKKGYISLIGASNYKAHITPTTLTSTRTFTLPDASGTVALTSDIPVSTATPTASTVSKFDSNAKMNSTNMTSSEVTDFVDGLDVSGINAVDYIVEQGTSESWTYRKWNSGIAECWYYMTGTTDSSGRWHYNPYLPTFLTSTQIIVNATGWSQGYVTTHAGYTKANYASNQWSIDGYLENGAVSKSCAVSLSVIGTWK